ncbi:MAG TPA: hypothetical protein VKA53_09245, partial [Thermoanaerobaculia bacterium]|nr:hypothetical protein [Thermoanaerobaculia bacterium]
GHAYDESLRQASAQIEGELGDIREVGHSPLVNGPVDLIDPKTLVDVRGKDGGELSPIEAQQLAPIVVLFNGASWRLVLLVHREYSSG